MTIVKNQKTRIEFPQLNVLDTMENNLSTKADFLAAGIAAAALVLTFFYEASWQKFFPLSFYWLFWISIA